MSHTFTSAELQQLYKYSYALTLHQSNAYDLLQTSLEKYLRKKPEQLDKPIAYLQRIMRNAHIDTLRHNKIIQWDDFDESTIDSTDMGWQSLEQMIIKENEVEQLLLCLSGIEREILFLWAIEGYTVQEVADLLVMPKGSVLSRIYRMRQRINKSQHDAYKSGVL